MKLSQNCHPAAWRGPAYLRSKEKIPAQTRLYRIPACAGMTNDKGRP